MAKTVQGFEIGDDGRMHQYDGKLTRAQRKSEARLIPVTPGPKNWRQRAARNLWG